MKNKIETKTYTTQELAFADSDAALATCLCRERFWLDAIVICHLNDDCHDVKLFQIVVADFA